MPVSNLCEMFLRDVSHLLVTNQLVRRSLQALRPECAFSDELTRTVDAVITLTQKCEGQLRSPLSDAGAILPVLSNGTASAIVTDFLSSIPTRATPDVFVAEIVSNLRLLVQHVELKAMLTAEAAILMGQTALSQALLKWSAEWRACGKTLRRATVRVRAKAYIADVDMMTPSFQPA